MSGNIKDGVYGYVGGTVSRLFDTKNGTAMEVEVKTEKQQYADKWTVWGAADTVATGDRVQVKGFLTASRDSYERDGERKFIVKRAVNNPELVKHEPQATSWGGDSDVPF